jgi:hypothetical protein
VTTRTAGWSKLDRCCRPPRSGATAAATIVNTSIETKVVYYSASWTSDSAGPAAGTPCSSVGLAVGAQTRQVVQVRGVYRRCG